MTRLILLALLFSSISQAQTTSSPANEKPAPEKVAAATEPAKPSLVADALADYRSEHYESAVEKYKKAIAADPKSAEAYAGLARAYLKQEKIDEAEDAVKSGIAVAPTANSIQTALGEVYFRQAKVAEAEAQFVKVINSGELDGHAYYGLAKIRSAMAMRKKARELTYRAHLMDPADPEIHRAWLFSLKRPARIKELTDYLSATTDNADSERRENLNRYLEILKDRERNPDRNCHLANKVPSTETRLVRITPDPQHITGYGLIVKFNKQNARLLLDTGASGLIVKRSIAEKAGIEKLSDIKIGGVGDAKENSGYLGYADSIQVGDLTFQNCLVEVTDKSIDSSMDGLIGSDVFSSYLVGIDFTSEKLKLTPLPKPPTAAAESASLKTEGEDEDDPDSDSGPQDRYIAPEMQNYTKIYRIGHDLLIPTRVADAPPKLFLIDTGAMTNAISAKAAREITKTHLESSIEIKGMSGKVNKVFTADKAVLQFSRYRQENQEMITWDFSRISKSSGIEISGFLGFVTLRMFELKIDYRDNLVDFDFNNKIIYGK